jgi:alkylation response protein AidB-like acyl-CoA dehydrogenase
LATISLTFGEPLARRQAIQWPLVELATEAQMLQALIRRTAAELDTRGHLEITDRVAMCNYRANRSAPPGTDGCSRRGGGSSARVAVARDDPNTSCRENLEFGFRSLDFVRDTPHHMPVNSGELR